MKKSLFMALAAGTFLFSACSSDDALNNDVAQDSSAQQIVLQVASSGDGLQTRAGRPLYSSAALQAVQNVRVLIYNPSDGNKIVYDSEKNLNWVDSKEYNDATGHGRRLTITLKGDDKIQNAGSYKIVAVGYSNGSDYKFLHDVAGNASLKKKTYADITATLAADKNAEEVFAGEADLTISSDLKIAPVSPEIGASVTLHRQVAGGFGYFTNIPAQIDGKDAKYLRLVMRSKNNVLTFNNFNKAFTTLGSNKMYVVNGSRTETDAPEADAYFSQGNVVYTNGDKGYTLYTINLTNWFPKHDVNGDGFLGYADYEKDNTAWTRPTTIKEPMIKGSVFASNFIIPFALESGKKTMELQLLDESENILKVWNVTIPSADVNTSAEGAKDVSASIFNVVRNHMYNLGVKNTQITKPDPTNPDPNPDPTPDPDPNPENPDNKPEDLSKGQNLVLKVNDNWETIHQMVIE